MVRESIPRQIDKKSRVPKEEKGIWGLEAETGVWNSQGGEKDKLFSPSRIVSGQVQWLSLSVPEPCCNETLFHTVKSR